MVIGKVTALRIALAAVVLLLAAATAPTRASAAECKGADASPGKLNNREASKATLCLINKERRDRHLRALNRQSQQTKAASRHTKTMVKKRCFSHQCPGEPDLMKRLEQVRYLPCRCSWGVGENIAFGSGRYASPRRIFKSWMHSSEHRANILNGSYQHIGIGVAKGSPTAGRGGDAFTYTTDFGYRR